MRVTAIFLMVVGVAMLATPLDATRVAGHHYSAGWQDSTALRDSPTASDVVSDQQSPDEYGQRAVSLCEGEASALAAEYGTVEGLLASHATTEQLFEAWADTYGQTPAPDPSSTPSPLSNADQSRFVALCYFNGEDGGFNRIPKGPPPGQPALDFSRISILAFEDGETRLFAAGPRAAMDPGDAPPPPTGTRR